MLGEVSGESAQNREFNVKTKQKLIVIIISSSGKYYFEAQINL